MDKDEFLAKHTFNEAGMTIARRVTETVTQDPSLSTQRAVMLLGLLLQRLEEKELLDISEIDEMLIEII